MIAEYEAMRVRQGWTLVRIRPDLRRHAPAMQEWLEAHVGRPVHINTWSEDARGGTWENWTCMENVEFLIQDPRLATMFKITWG